MKIICIGRNYIEHARELDSPLPDKPVFFMKPDTSLVIRNRPFFYPEFSADVHHEIELVIKICKNGKYIDPKFSHSYYKEIGLGIDFTARDLQKECKKGGLPWEIAKSFDHSAPVSKMISLESAGEINNIDFHLDLNGSTVQTGNSKDMIFSFDQVISYISRFITLKMGDLIFTGTPAGVSPVKIGDHLEGYLGKQKMLDFYVR
jgi:2-keto-4-pentenoate hydratase/2-oxohepta-3-ene-1,7-dioic acid hydratase in catechol pathway